MKHNFIPLILSILNVFLKNFVTILIIIIINSIINHRDTAIYLYCYKEILNFKFPKHKLLTIKYMHHYSNFTY